MQLILDIYDAAGNRLGEGPVTTLTGATVTRLLDGVGTILFEVPATDERALTLLTPRRRFRLFAEYQSEKREIGRGIVMKRDLNEGDGGATFAYECADVLAELKDANTLIGRAYSQETVSDVVDGLLALATGWTASVETGVASMVVDARFDGVSVLDALLELCENNGIHLRLAASGKVVEIGAFGDASGVKALSTETASSEIYMQQGIGLITSISAGEDAEDVVNWIIPLGSGEDAASLKLKRSTRVSPYTIQNAVGPNGKKYWYLSDAASITAYGQSQRVVTFKGIAPIANTAADKENAANALYDAAAAFLDRMKVPRKNYSLSLAALKETLRPGDKIHVRHRGRVMKNGVPVDYAAINEDLWMMSVTESFGLESAAAVLVDVSNVDKSADGIGETIVRSLNEVSLRGLRPLAGVSCRTYVYDREIADGIHCTVPLEISNATLEVVRVRVRLKTSPLRATSVQGEHRHVVAQRVGVSGLLPTTGVQLRMVSAADGSGSFAAIYMPAAADPGVDFWTYGAGGAVQYGVVDDTVTPVGVSIRVNNVVRNTEFGGPWAPSGGALDFVLDIGEMTRLITEDAGGLYQEHKIQFRCSGGHGRCEVTVEVYEVLQSIDVS